MITIKVKQGENIDRALKRFKRKFTQQGVTKQLRENSYFQKPSVKRRKEKIKAKYRQKLIDRGDI